jgi:acetyl esterase/lipase
MMVRVPVISARYLVIAILFMLTTRFLLAQQLGPRDIDALPASEPTVVQHYGPDALQFGELRLPAGRGPFPVAVVIHGGCWTKGLATCRNTAPIASDLTKSGIATWNIEYREVGDAGGGWPGTFLDWGAAVDYLRTLAKTYPLDLSKVVVLGHSAGGHAALWIAARHRLSADSPVRGADPLPIEAAVSIDGPGDLAGFVGFDAQICGESVVVPLMGGTPAEKPELYRQASPQALLPLGVPQFLVSAVVLTSDKAQKYQELAQAKGDRVEVLTLDTGHFELIAPGNKAWEAVKRLILDKAFRG